MRYSKYANLTNHSYFSNFRVVDSIAKPEDIIDAAFAMELSGIAFTEHDALSGVVKYNNYYHKKIEDEWKKIGGNSDIPFEEKVKKLDFKLIMGNEIYLSAEGTDSKIEQPQFFNYILLAKDREGFAQLEKISSAAWERAWFKGIQRTPTYPSDLFNNIKGGHLIAITDGMTGYCAIMVQRILASGGKDEISIKQLANHLNMMQELFGKGNFYIELIASVLPNAVKYNKYMMEHFWGKYDFIYASDVHFVKQEQLPLQLSFLKSGQKVSTDEDFSFDYLMKLDEIKEILVGNKQINAEQFDTMTRNTKAIADACQIYDLKAPQVVPKVKYEDHKEYDSDVAFFKQDPLITKEKYPDFWFYLNETDDPADIFLMRLVAHGFVQKYKNSWNLEQYYARLNEEFWTLRSVSEKIGQNMDDYFITMAKMIDIIWEKGDSIVGPARGSAGVFLINYLIGITEMNPVQLNLPYVWRFLHPSRPDMPDQLRSASQEIVM